MSEGAKTPEASEKEASQLEEKDQDTASRASKTPVGSKPGSPKSKSGSKPGSAKSATGSNRGGSGKSTKSKTSIRSGSPRGKKSAKSRRSISSELPSALPPGEDDGVLPEGCIPIFLSGKTQEIFNCRGDEDVTADRPYKLLKKEDIKQDFFNRAAVSDFTPYKMVVNEYPEEELLIVYDYEFRHGQNFYLATTVEAKQKILFKAGLWTPVEEEEEEEDTTVYVYTPPESKPWISLGSEAEITPETPRSQRKQTKISIKRTRREFGAPLLLEDLNVADAKSNYQECTAFQDPSYELKRLELDKSIQAIPEFTESCSQTDWKYPRNANTQYEPREFSEEEAKTIAESTSLHTFIRTVLPRFELAMQQNAIMDVFYDDWMRLSDDDSTFGSKADNHLKEYQSFTDLQFSKDKTITCIEWHPTIRGVVAVAVAEKMSFDERIDMGARVIMTPSLILIWSFTDPIHPQLLLEAPDDICCFKICPTDVNIIAGGCVNGQVVLWDISAFADRLKTQRGSNKQKNNLRTLESAGTSRAKPGFEDENAMETPIVRYCAVSSIEHSHRAPITDIQWMPDHMELSRMGIPQENKSGSCVQIITCAADHPSMHWDIWLNKKAIKEQQLLEQLDNEKDEKKIAAMIQAGAGRPSEDELLDEMPGSILVWDIRAPKTSHQQTQQPDKKQEQIRNPMGVATTFKHLDLTWKPQLKVNLMKSEPGGDHSPTKFSISEVQGDRSSFATEEIESAPPGTGGSPEGDDKENKKEGGGASGAGGAGGFNFAGTKPGSAAKKTLATINTHLYVGTEDGEIVYVDWMPQKDQDTGKIQTPKPAYYHSSHDGPVVTLERSPFFRDIILCIGGWTFSVWKEGVNSGPILQSNACGKRLTRGAWSPTRPGVFYISKNDGTVDVWDLLDRTHEPSMTQSVSPVSITCIFPYQVTPKQHLLGVGDMSGTLHILEIPWSLRQPTHNELNGVSNYFEREVKRRAYVVARWDFREKEKMQIEAELKQKAGIAPNVTLTEEEVEQRQKVEYAAYLEQESNFLRSLGLKEDRDDFAATE